MTDIRCFLAHFGMSYKQYVDNLALPLLSELDKLKNRLFEELKANETLRQNQVKHEEQMRIETEKTSALEMENSAKDVTIKKLRKEVEKLTQQEEQSSESVCARKSIKRKQVAPTEPITKVARVLRTRKGTKNQQPSQTEAPVVPLPPTLPAMWFR